MKLIVGLGNPGEKYSDTRHNLGFESVDKLGYRVQGTGYSWKMEDKFKAQICNLKTETYNLILAKPQTYMNNSGVAVKLLTAYYKLQPADLIVIHDDLDLPLGKIQIRLGGAAAGHHGVESVIEALETDQFIRIRLGIDNAGSEQGESFVLSEFRTDEKARVEKMLKNGVEVLEVLLSDGLEKAQNRFN